MIRPHVYSSHLLGKSSLGPWQGAQWKVKQKTPLIFDRPTSWRSWAMAAAQPAASSR